MKKILTIAILFLSLGVLAQQQPQTGPKCRAFFEISKTGGYYENTRAADLYEGLYKKNPNAPEVTSFLERIRKVFVNTGQGAFAQVSDSTLFPEAVKLLRTCKIKFLWFTKETYRQYGITVDNNPRAYDCSRHSYSDRVHRVDGLEPCFVWEVTGYPDQVIMSCWCLNTIFNRDEPTLVIVPKKEAPKPITINTNVNMEDTIENVVYLNLPQQQTVQNDVQNGQGYYQNSRGVVIVVGQNQGSYPVNCAQNGFNAVRTIDYRVPRQDQRY